MDGSTGEAGVEGDGIARRGVRDRLAQGAWAAVVDVGHGDGFCEGDACRLLRSRSLLYWRRLPGSQGQDQDCGEKQKTCSFDQLCIHMILLIDRIGDLHSGPGRFVIQFVLDLNELCRPIIKKGVIVSGDASRRANHIVNLYSLYNFRGGLV